MGTEKINLKKKSPQMKCVYFKMTFIISKTFGSSSGYERHIIFQLHLVKAISFHHQLPISPTDAYN